MSSRKPITAVDMFCGAGGTSTGLAPEQVNFFADWSDRDFTIWLAAFLEGEGCIYLANGPGVEITIANTNRDVIESIRLRTGCGSVTEVTFDRAAWKTKYLWRARRWRDVRKLLVDLMPFLTFKRAKALAALEKLSHLSREESARVELIDKVLALRDKGLTQQQIADRVGCTRSNVSILLNPPAPKSRHPLAFTSRSERVTKQKATVRTKTRLVAGRRSQ